MASMMYIYEVEDKLIQARLVFPHVVEAYRLEMCQGDGELIPANRDSWGTLWSNAQALRSQLNQLLDAMQSEFGAF